MHYMYTRIGPLSYCYCTHIKSNRQIQQSVRIFIYKYTLNEERIAIFTNGRKSKQLLEMHHKIPLIKLNPKWEIAR